jgi:hypothetical protein
LRLLKIGRTYKVHCEEPGDPIQALMLRNNKKVTTMLDMMLPPSKPHITTDYKNQGIKYFYKQGLEYSSYPRVLEPGLS